MQRQRHVSPCSAISLPSTLCRRSSAATRRAMPLHSKTRPNCALPTPSESLLCHRRAAQLRAGKCLALAKRHRSTPLRVCAMPMPCLSALCRRTDGRFAAMRHCDAVFAPPLHCSSARCLCVAHRSDAPAGLCSAPALPGQAQSGDAPIVATAAPCQASPPHCRAKLCHRVAPNAAQFLAIALQVQATQRLCQAGQCTAVPSLCDAHLALPRPCSTSHRRRLTDALPLLGARCSSSPLIRDT